MKYFLLIFVLLFITADYADAKNCKKGKPCGNTCIARDKECHVGKSPYNPSIYNSSSDSIIYTTPRSSDSIIYTAPRRSSARPQISYECNGVIVSESQFKECNSPQISSEENGISTNTDDKNKKKSKRTTTVPTEILDADIFQPSGKKKKIRLYGIDAPEEGQAFYQEAKDMLEKLIYKKKITVKIYSDDSDEIDAAVVFVNGKNVNELMLEAGYAWVHVGLCTELFCDDWIQIENEVKSEKKGLWADSNRLPPWIWR